MERFKWIVEFGPHRREDLIAECTPVAYDPAAEAPLWLAFLERVQPDPVMRAFIRDFHGYGLTALTGIQAFIFNTGKGANGKSTFIECVMRIVGPYGNSLNPESFTAGEPKRAAARPTRISQICPACACCASLNCRRTLEFKKAW